MSTRRPDPVQPRQPRDKIAAYRRRGASGARPRDVSLPFRWDVSRLECLGSFLRQDNGNPTSEAQFQRWYRPNYDGFFHDLLDCAARTVALAGDADLMFVGRSPESLFDLLSGFLDGTRWRERLALLHFSTGSMDMKTVRREHPQELRAFRAYLDSLGVSPRKLIYRERPAALVDLVCSGNTMEQLLELLHDWAVEQNADWDAVRRNLRVVAIVKKDDEQPPRPRWRQRRDRRDASYFSYAWYTDRALIEAFRRRGQVREVAVSSQLWEFLGDWQAKVTPSYSPELWGSSESARPCHAFEHLEGVRAARALYEAGCTPRVRAQFVRRLTAETAAMQEPWFRTLVGLVGEV